MKVLALCSYVSAVCAVSVWLQPGSARVVLFSQTLPASRRLVEPLERLSVVKFMRHVASSDAVLAAAAAALCEVRRNKKILFVNLLTICWCFAIVVVVVVRISSLTSFPVPLTSLFTNSVLNSGQTVLVSSTRPSEIIPKRYREYYDRFTDCMIHCRIFNKKKKMISKMFV